MGEIVGVPTAPAATSPEDVPAAYMKSYWTVLWMNPIASLLSVILPIFLTFLLACCYKQFHADAPLPLMIDNLHNTELLDNGVWRYLLLDCLAAPRYTCILAFCCPALRWADTMRLSGIYSFFTAVFIFAFFSSLAKGTAGLTTLILICILTAKRQKIRSLFSLPHGTARTWVEDCCTYCWCAPCAIVQEAQQMEEAYSVQHKVQREELDRRQGELERHQKEQKELQRLNAAQEKTLKERADALATKSLRPSRS